jgi:hypothetical protein
VCISATSAGRIYVKFVVGEFYENLATKNTFGESLAEISDTLREDLRKFYCCLRCYIGTKALSSSDMISGF